MKRRDEIKLRRYLQSFNQLRTIKARSVKGSVYGVFIETSQSSALKSWLVEGNRAGIVNARPQLGSHKLEGKYIVRIINRFGMPQSRRYRHPTAPFWPRSGDVGWSHHQVPYTRATASGEGVKMLNYGQWIDQIFAGERIKLVINYPISGLSFIVHTSDVTTQPSDVKMSRRALREEWYCHEMAVNDTSNRDVGTSLFIYSPPPHRCTGADVIAAWRLESMSMSHCDSRCKEVGLHLDYGLTNEILRCWGLRNLFFEFDWPLPPPLPLGEPVSSQFGPGFAGEKYFDKSLVMGL